MYTGTSGAGHGMMKSVLGLVAPELSLLDAFTTITSGAFSLLSRRQSGRTNKKLEQLDSRIAGEKMMAQVRSDAARATSAAVAVLSTSSIDISVGSPRMIIDHAISAANKEVARILRSTL